MTEQHIGIDLGTTNSLIAHVLADGNPEIITNRSQEPFTPSVIGLRSGRTREGANRFIAGRQALNNANRDPKNTVRSVKRFMGLPYSDPRVTVAKRHVHYEVSESPATKGTLVIRIGGDLLTPEELSMIILAQLKEDAVARLGGSLGGVVITCPAYFNAPQRQATHKAGILAGLTVKALLDEPTAAYLYESRGSPRERERVLVFDFGGGTLDISLIQRQGNRFNVLNYTGDNFLGGDDIDRALMERVMSHIAEQGGAADADNAGFLCLLQQHAEQAKKMLCAGESGYITIPASCRKKDGSFLDLDLEITVEEFEVMLEPIKTRIARLLEDYLKRENYAPEHFDEVLMVGGSSAVPQVQRLLRDLFEKDKKQRVRLAKRPMEAVALGAALYAGMIKGVVCPSCSTENLLDAQACSSCGTRLHMASFAFDKDAENGGGSVSSRLPWSMGVRYRRTATDADAYKILLKKGDSYPKESKAEFRIPLTSGFNIEVYEGDDQQATKNRLICIVQVSRKEIPSDVKDNDPVEVQFIYNRDRTLLVAVSYPRSQSNFNPRWQVNAPTESNTDDAVKDLTALLPRARNFLDEYKELMGQGPRKKLEDDLGKAEPAVMAGNVEEAKRLCDAIQAMMFNGAGVASTLFLAENTVANEDPEFGSVIRERAASLRKMSQNGAKDTEPHRRDLEELILKAIRKLRGGSPVERVVRDDSMILLG